MRSLFRYGGALCAALGLVLAAISDPRLQLIGIAMIVAGVVAFMLSWVSGGDP